MAVHVDDFLMIASSKVKNEKFKTQMRETCTISDPCTISDLGTIRFVIGIGVAWVTMKGRPNCHRPLSLTNLYKCSAKSMLCLCLSQWIPASSLEVSIEVLFQRKSETSC